jgi:uncharacterized membrane protein YhaH (DUF805 family)
MILGTTNIRPQGDRAMNFVDAVASCFSQYATFSGRALRSEYWWWTLFVFLGSIATAIVNDKVSFLFSLATLLPYLAVGARRLHDIGKSGWWQLVNFIPLLGWILMIIWCTREGEGENEYGPALSAG